MKLLAQVWALLTPGERRRCIALQLLALLMGLATVAGIAAVMPFFAVLGDPTLLERNAALRWLHAQLPTLGGRGFTVFLGGLFIVMLLAGSAVNLLGSVAMARFAWRVGDRLRVQLFARYLARDYLFHARTSGTLLASRVLYQSDRVTGLLQSAFVFVSNGVMGLLICASLALVDVRVAAAGFGIFGASYLLLYGAVRRRLLANGLAQSAAGAERAAAVDQSLAGIKDLLLAQGQAPFVRRMAEATQTISRAASSTQWIGLAPRYLLESLAGVILIVAALLLSSSRDTASWLASLTFFAVAGYRLLPAVQQCYFGYATARANQHAFEEVVADLGPVAVEVADAAPTAAAARLPREAIEMHEVRFRYQPGAAPAVDGLTLRIEAGSTVAFVGPNGSGKTTAADLLLGLLTPDGGIIRVDGTIRDGRNTAAWRLSAACVPQQVFILDASVRENIALGVEDSAIDEARLAEAARIAGAHAFIARLPRGYHEPLGSRGARLSGGQRQLIGLARALYRAPSLLVLDEATSSLDVDAAQAVVELLDRLRGRCTVVVITHHPAVAAACDRQLEFREGRVFERSGGRDLRAMS